MNKFTKYSILTSLTIIEACSFAQAQTKWEYPLIKADTSKEIIFGKEVVDPYRNLENMDNEEVVNWFSEERSFTDSVLSHISNREKLRQEYNELKQVRNNHIKLPRCSGNMLFYQQYSSNEKTRNIYASDYSFSTPVLLFSTEELNKIDSTTYRIDYYEPSYDGKYIAFGLMSEKSASPTLYILDVENKKILEDKIPGAMSSNPQWLPDNSGFFYKHLKHIDKHVYNDTRIKLHFLGTNPENDKEVFSNEVTKGVEIRNTDLPRIYVTPGCEYLLGTVNTGGSNYSSVYYAKFDDVINKPADEVKWKGICTIDEKISAYLLKGTELYCISNNINPNGRFEKINIFNPSEREILYEAKDVVLSDILGTKNFVYLTYQMNGFSKLLEFDYTSKTSNNIELPFPGKIDLTPSFIVTSPYSHSDKLIFGMVSWNREWKVYSVLADKKPERLNIIPDDDVYNLNDIIVEVVEVTSHDGVKVPLSIIYRKGILKNGQSPTLLYGYGSYGVSYTPGFAFSRLLWLNKGGIIAFAHIRGGGIKGEEWHLAGMKKTKPNTWKDFIACAEYLVKEKYTSNEKMAAYGMSGGGITVGRAITERPGLFKACVLDVGSMNISRYEVTDSTGGDVEFGTATDSLEFSYLYNMDSYLHINDNEKYPSVFAMAGLKDKNVSPWEPAKFCARLQQIPNSNNVVLLWPHDGDHIGAWDYDLELSNYFSFLFWQLGHKDFVFTTK